MLVECEALGDTRRSIFGKEELVAPGEIPDFSDLPLYQVISFLKEVNFESLTMRPYLEEYYPAKLNKDGSNKGLVDARKAFIPKGAEYLSKYMYHIRSHKERNCNQPI